MEEKEEDANLKMVATIGKVEMASAMMRQGEEADNGGETDST